jgi:membrane protein implicated in regulation of membrane protease activity
LAGLSGRVVVPLGVLTGDVRGESKKARKQNWSGPDFSPVASPHPFNGGLTPIRFFFSLTALDVIIERSKFLRPLGIGRHTGRDHSTKRMTFFYWLALVLGGGLFLLSLAGELVGAHGHFHSPSHVDVGGGAHHDDFDWGKLFSLRNVTYFLFAFGAAGVLLNLTWDGEREVLTALAATLTGVLAWVFSSFLFGYLRTSESGERQTDSTLIGRVGQVTLPILPGRTGKVMITRSGQIQELVAKAMDAEEPAQDSWSSVVIVDVRDGIALVAPYSEEPQS